ncbi:MAG: 30S ribosomal protein S16 [Candidatus Magasanikbacteria bacterium]|nr:30S ribosomal protein S16 [Candidatus Magasanikbacteria bacterium]
MLTIKLARFGKAKEPTFRLILTEKTKNPNSAYLENLGSYDARKKVIVLKADRITYWISKGAQTTTTIHNLLVDQKVISGDKIKKVKLTARRKVKLAEKKKAAETKATEVKPVEAAPAEVKAE